MYLKNVTLICVAGVEIEKSYQAFLYSTKDIHYGGYVFISPCIPSNFSDKHTYIKCDKLTPTSFSEFMFYELYKYFSTSHCLFVHHDGFVLNYNLWDDEFLNYDYIGAPWPFNSNNPNANLVGNGGFSLRSKKILELPSVKNIKLISTNDMPYPVEDMNYCAYNLKTFLDNNIKYAPIQLASKFSTEINIPSISRESFGFHSFKFNPQYSNILI